MVDRCLSKLVNVVSGVLQGSVLSPLLFPLYTSDLFSILENKLIGHTHDSTLIAVAPSSGVTVVVEKLMNRDLGKVSKWCDNLGMKLNESKTKTIIVSRPGAMHLLSPLINYFRSCAKGV